MKFETAADLLTWKNGEVEENMVLEFAQQYEKLTDEEKSELIETAKSAHKEYVQKMIKRVKEPRKRMISCFTCDTFSTRGFTSSLLYR
jgi:hypothetical protein